MCVIVSYNLLACPGHCYACTNQGVEDLKHPVTGGFETGLPDDTPTSDFCYSYDEAGGG
jgi:hypothetical protein